MFCIHCKGNHQDKDCPVFARKQVYSQLASISDEFQGNSPTPFVGRYGYPNVNVGLLSIPEQRDDAWLYDAPKEWAGQGFDIPKLVKYRSSLLNTRFKVSVKQEHKWLGIAQEIAMASKPAAVDIRLKDKPKFSLITDPYSPPTGPLADLRSVDLTSNPSIPTRVEQAVDDTDLKASEAITGLYEHGIDENRLTRLLSVGTLGIGKNRKLVPTRWSITATDDMLGKHLLAEIKRFTNKNEFAAFYGQYLGNHYLLLFFPDNWSYELFETYVPASKGRSLQYSTDFEGFEGRKTYAQSCVGGYYTVRLAIAEKLAELKRQGSCIALRFITDEYTVPLGVWVTREATRKALSGKPIQFAGKELLIDYAKKFVMAKFGLDISALIKQSKLLDQHHQKQLAAFI